MVRGGKAIYGTLLSTRRDSLLATAAPAASPPILIGGNGEKKTLRLVARYADACNVSPAKGLGVLQHKLDVLREHCANEGRPYDAIEKTVLTHLKISRDGANGTMTPAEVIERFHQWSELGITHVMCGLANMHEEGSLELLGSDIIPVVSQRPQP